jgi:hypothetical protein
VGWFGVERPLVICWLPEPERHHLWPAIYALLEPAAKIGGVPVLEEHDLVWLAIDGPTILAAATTRLLKDGQAEIKHVGGGRMKDWFGPFEATLCAWARGCGATAFISRGRKGWGRLNTPLGWAVIGEEAGLTLYEKAL